MSYASLLSGSQISLVSSPHDGDLATIAQTIQYSARIGGRGDLEEVICGLLEETAPGLAPTRTLDLIGHSTSDHSLLRLGYWVIDATKLSVTAFFRELADHDVMRRLGIRAVRLLGCETALTATGRSTICALSEILGIEVMGTRVMVGASHYTPAGFSADFSHALVPASELRATCSPTGRQFGDPYRRTLDIGALPASPLSSRPWPVALATTEQGRDIVRLLLRNDGAYMPSLDPAPELEIALPSVIKPGWVHALQLVLDGNFVRVYPDPGGPGVVFPVEHPDRLRDLVRELDRIRPDR